NSLTINAIVDGKTYTYNGDVGIDRRERRQNGRTEEYTVIDSTVLNQNIPKGKKFSISILNSFNQKTNQTFEVILYEKNSLIG
ncbi:MAG: hypothetical protein Q7R47_01615, partial [Candidatus Diapherotrites archaeon]|nr:hypothetical protein [Candidatus Diapherotrites archaeon]